MNKKTAIIIVCCLIVFIIIRVNIAFNFLDEPDHHNTYTPDLPVAFTSTLPCADCPGIEYELHLQEEAFTEFSFYTDRDSAHFTESGNWEIKSGTLIIHPGDSSKKKRYLISDQNLKLLDRSGSEISGDLANHYFLEKNTEFQSIMNRHQELRENGVIFTAGGNEPFWSIQVFSSDSLVYKEPGGEVKSTSLRITDSGEGKEYQAAFDTGNSIKAITEERFCIDSMSGFKFTHAVTISLSGETKSGCGTTL